ncbi:hypothetical protein ABFS82_12G148500 [Erythranthe guttata]
MIPSKRLRNKIAGFSTHLMNHIQKGYPWDLTQAAAGGARAAYGCRARRVRH